MKYFFKAQQIKTKWFKMYKSKTFKLTLYKVHLNSELRKCTRFIFYSYYIICKFFLFFKYTYKNIVIVKFSRQETYLL